MNQFDTSLIRSKFIDSSYEVVPWDEVADIYVINTCTVTSGGDRASRQAIYRAKRKNPNAVVVATGCYAQIKPEELLSLDEVDLVIGNTHKAQVLELVEDFLEQRKKRAVVGEIFRENTLESFDTVVYFEDSRPFVKVQEGCNKFCTFCVIPFARGKVRSAPKEKVIEHIRFLVDRGFQEVVLSGTQLSQYGWDIGSSLEELVKEVLNIKGLELLRLSSMHIGEIENALLELMLSEERIAPHFHLSLQSGSNRILSLMQRGYRKEDYERTADTILSRRPETALGTDIIVGFPSESDEDFEETLEFVERLPFAYLHLFPYSDRKDTKASLMKEKIPERVKKERLKLLMELDAKKRKEFYEKHRGSELRATVLGNGKLLTENYLTLNREANSPPGRVIRVKL